MRAHGAATPQGAIGRADLLRLLAIAPRDQVLLDDSSGGWFGYERRPEAPPPVTVPKAVHEPAPMQPGAQPAVRLPLQMPFAFAIVRREMREAAPAEQPPDDPSPGTAFDESSLTPREPKRRIGYEDLVPWPRLLPALRRQLATRRTGALDLDRLAKQLASGCLPRRLPRRVHERWHPDLVVVLDFSARLWPYREDMHRLAERLVSLVGHNRISLRIINHGPLQCWTDWVEQQNRHRARLPTERPWAMPPAGTPVLLVTDAGLLPGPGSEMARDWRRFADRLASARVRALALMPLGAGQLDASFPLPVLRWSPDARPHPVRARGKAGGKPAGLDDLLAMAAVVRRIDPPLLRAMRHLLPEAPLNAGLEGAVWCHPDVDAGFTASVRKAAGEVHRRRFAGSRPSLQARIEDLRQRHHAHLNRALDHEELLLWDAYADPAARHDDCPVGDDYSVSDALAFFRALADAVSQPEDAPETWRQIAAGVCDRADAAMIRRHGAVYHRLVAAVAKSNPDAPPVVPDWVDPAILASLLPSEHAPGTAWLVQDARRGAVVLQAETPGPRQIALGDPAPFDAGGISVQAAGEPNARLHSAASLPVVLARLDDPKAEARLTTATETLQVAAVSRPRGTLGWGYGRSGLEARSPQLAGGQERWTGDALRVSRRSTDGRWAFETRATKPAAKRSPEIEFGIDADYGVWAELFIATAHGIATQRFRWIEAGSFWMGAPEDEPGRDDVDGPRHLVTLTSGFWLADTPCTQAYWQAVMGDNPSSFKGPDRPVDQVSWEDVQRFLAALEQLLPGCGASLPSEAEWEHACRAGATGAIYTGDLAIFGERNAPALDPIAWYGGNSGVDFDLDNGWESSDWEEKQYPHEHAGTRAVAGKQPNAWGLYDMLGNVWEWCADGQRTFTNQPQVDPWHSPGEGDEAPRAMRGGSWIDCAGRVRSACRLASHPGRAYGFLGFRLSLRSIEPGRSGLPPELASVREKLLLGLR